MACCDWETFEGSFLSAWKRKKFGETLIDWVRAKKDWKKHHCTGGEAAAMQIGVLVREADYLWIQMVNKRDKGDDGGLGAAVRPRVPVLS